jgi:hypothetical protein
MNLADVRDRKSFFKVLQTLQLARSLATGYLSRLVGRHRSQATGLTEFH